MITAWIVLATELLFAALAFGWRSWRQWRRTGSTGFRGVSGRPGSAEWLGGVLLVVALLLAAAAPVAVLAGLAPAWPAPPVVAPLGAALGALGFAGTLAAQLAMGDAWRIGVDAAERTALVQRGPFRYARNPIFTSMLAFLLGTALLVPGALSLGAFAAALIGLELQVRMVEEPYLLRAHGDAYARYAARVGRFVPLVGRLRAARPAQDERVRGS